MKVVLLLQLFFCAAGATALNFIATTQGAISYLEGSSLILLNLALLGWAWSKILNKKLVALATSVIVIKYAIFAIIIYKVLADPETQKVWFVVGLSTLLPTVLSYAILMRIKKPS